MLKRVEKFSAEWCAPCKVLAPIYHKISLMEQFKDIDFYEINIEDDDVQDKVMELKIMSIPTIVMYDEKGNVINKVIGFVSEQQLLAALSETKTENNNE